MACCSVALDQKIVPGDLKLLTTIPMQPLHSSSCLRFTLFPFTTSLTTTTTRTNMSSSSSIRASSETSPHSFPVPENRIVLGCGATCIDYLATVDSYPKPDDKIRSTSLKIQGGGNAGNALTCAARLGLNPRLISKVADDAQGRGILEELEADGVDTSYLVVSKDGNSPFTYVIVDKQTARLVYFDSRLYETALVVGNEEWTGASSIPSALVFMLLRLPNVKFVIVTLGEDGCIMLERSTDGSLVEEMDVDSLLELLKQSLDGNINMPLCISSKVVMRLKANKLGAVNGILHVGSAEKIPPSELIDTTGAGDAFIGAVLYAICADKPPQKMLPFAASVAAAACRALGARSGLPRRTDPWLSSYSH
ncbi:hypothetical protein IFM89_038358 [Coptis chinensis]|uniref:Carbohydrate kinase PfkB domain-containing protein n=1 Tax=Coptis chinensis TaxID=261450 RepID=A0A835I3X5_9MAGN|nr:hypothetical protein IFM89_038358 [Coptis chinensis]